LTASDADEGMNGQVMYSFQTLSTKGSQMYKLDHDTGTITLLQSLDFESGDSYELEV
ncbi:PCDGB protein, partial [Centropus unirufus]|nr:PCDGB protein [Centropus unirufus]